MINIYSKAKNKDIIVRFENIPQYINEIKDGEYCMESNDLIDTILKLNTYDEVKITFEDLNIIKEIPVNNKYFISKNSWKSNPFEHQLDGIEFGKNHNCWLLLDDPGLGKTLQMIYLAKELKLQKNLEHCLIICGINSSKVN